MLKIYCLSTALETLCGLLIGSPSRWRLGIHHSRFAMRGPIDFPSHSLLQATCPLYETGGDAEYWIVEDEQF
jgi:hypothetical protein